MKLLHYILLAISFFFICSSNILAASASEIAGIYELSGVMEMAGAIKLSPNQKYEARFSYGSADWIEEGDWKLVGNNSVVLSGAHFKAKNTNDLPLFLTSGMQFTYTQGKLTSDDQSRHVTFINPNKTPSSKNAAGETKPGEGRMHVKGEIVKLDSDILEVKMKECIDFDVHSLSPEVLQAAKKSKSIDVEIPYSAIIGGETCP